MTIVFFARRFYPQIGGVEKHVFELSKRLVLQGHRVSVVTEMGDQSYHEVINGIEIYRIPVGKEDKFKKFRIWQQLWRPRKIIGSADVIHCHDVFFWYLPFLFIYPRKPVYTTFHGYESYPIKKKAVLVRKFSEKLSWGSICIGSFIKKWYGTRPDYVSYGAVEISSHVIARTEESRALVEGTTKQSPENSKKSRGLPRSPGLIGIARNDGGVFIGRLDEQTGILEYVKAVELVKKQFPKFELLVVGDGEYRKKIEKKVKSIGFRKDPEKYFTRYRFAFVSRYLAILEAIAAKRLVFAHYDNPVKEDYLRMAPFAAWIIIARTPEELAKKVVYYLRHPEEERMLIGQAYAWVKEQSWEKMARLYFQLWKKSKKDV